MKTYDELVSFVEQYLGSKLLPYQRLLLKVVYESQKYSITLPKYNGYTHMKELINQFLECKK